jgi:hypothetical protein
MPRLVDHDGEDVGRHPEQEQPATGLCPLECGAQLSDPEDKGHDSGQGDRSQSELARTTVEQPDASSVETAEGSIHPPHGSLPLQQAAAFMARCHPVVRAIFSSTASAVPPLQALSPKARSVITSPSLRVCLIILLRWGYFCSSSSAAFPTASCSGVATYSELFE